jgi:hypothetical protein
LKILRVLLEKEKKIELREKCEEKELDSTCFSF